MLLQPPNQFWQSLREPRNFVDVALVFLLVYALLRLIRGTRAAPMAAGLGALALIYWAAARYDLSTLEFILRPAPVYVGVAIVVREETGLVSFVQGGQIRRGLDGTRLRAAMLDAMEPRGREPEPEAEKQAETETLSTEVRGQRSEVS
jgi:DNA integrity scanning protein DisA with diadenylate cyclase activity